MGSESKFAELLARPQDAVRCTTAKLASDPNNSALKCKKHRKAVLFDGALIAVRLAWDFFQHFQANFAFGNFT